MEKIYNIIKEYTKNSKINIEDIVINDLNDEEFDALIDILKQRNIEIINKKEDVLLEELNIGYLNCGTKYMQHLREYKQLKREDEQKLFEAYKNGDMSAREKIIEANLKLVLYKVDKYYGKTKSAVIDFLDLVQEGNKGLIRAVDKFDISKGYRFSTYAIWWIEKSIYEYIAYNYKAIRISVYSFNRLSKLKKFESNFKEEYKKNPELNDYYEGLGYTKTKVKNTKLRDFEILSITDEEIKDDKKISKAIREYEQFSKLEDEMYIESLINELSIYLNQSDLTILLLRNGFINGTPYTLQMIADIYGVERESIRQKLISIYKKARIIAIERLEKNNEIENINYIKQHRFTKK